MTTVTITAISLGHHADLDPDESRTGAEYADHLIGATFGDASSPLAHNVVELTLNDGNNDGRISFNAAAGNPEGDYIGSQSNPHYLDTGILYRGTVTYVDGSTLSDVPLRIVQDVSGNMVLLPPPANATQVEIDMLTTKPLHSITIDSLRQNNFTALGSANYTAQSPSFICFCNGTRIMTPQGDVAVEHLRLGDMVLTRDHGPQPLRWIGRKALDGHQLSLFAQLRPVRIRAGALGNGLPLRDLKVSQQHRVLVQSRIAERIFGQPEVLVAAKHLVGLDGIQIDDSAQPLEYFHLLFDQHEVLYSEGALTESLFTGPEALKAVDPAARAEILALFPELAGQDPDRIPARQIGKGLRARQLAQRHAKNRQPLQLAPC